VTPPVPGRDGRIGGKVAIVTGSGSGIGQAIALRFGREGALVVTTDLRETTAETTAGRIRAAGGRALALPLDVTVEGAAVDIVARATAAYGTVDILVNNAGAGADGGPLDLDLATWDRMLRLNLTGSFLAIQAVLPVMLDRRYGSIVNISSVNGILAVGEEAYSAAKAGLVNLTRNIAIRYGPDGVRSNVICPGTIRTPNWSSRIAARPDIVDRLAAWYPMRRIGEPEDVAAAALFLASDESAWITGAMLPVDGGLTAGMPRMMDDLAG